MIVPSKNWIHSQAARLGASSSYWGPSSPAPGFGLRLLPRLRAEAPRRLPAQSEALQAVQRFPSPFPVPSFLRATPAPCLSWESEHQPVFSSLLPLTHPVTLGQVMGTLWIEVPKGFGRDDLSSPSAGGCHGSGNSRLPEPRAPRIPFPER